LDNETNNRDDFLTIRIKNGNKDAFKLLYDRYSKRLYCFSIRYLRSKVETEELVQTVFISLWEHRKSLDATMSVKNYIYRSAVNYIYNFQKRKAVRMKFAESEFQKEHIQSNITYDQVFFHDLEEKINSIVETLPSKQQKIFRLSRIDGLSHEKIAKKLDISVRTVENQIYRALKFIKNNLPGEIFLLIWLLLLAH
jgi:RNA polymerase sigma-19 factor, ECF subfamily